MQPAPVLAVSMEGILIALVIVALLFGSSQIPKLARSMGQASKEFRKGLDEGAQAEPPDSGEQSKPSTNGT